MPAKKKQPAKRTQRTKKIGSDPKAARQFGGKNDFGVPETWTRNRSRICLARKQKSNDPGGSFSHSGSDTARTTGVGGNKSGVGSSSGGDVDTDIIGVGTGGTTISQSGPDDRRDGPDMTDGSESTRGGKLAPEIPASSAAGQRLNSRSQRRGRDDNRSRHRRSFRN